MLARLEEKRKILKTIKYHIAMKMNEKTDLELQDILENGSECASEDVEAARYEIEKRRNARGSNNSVSKERIDGQYYTRVPVVGEDNMSQSNPANSIYLFALIGGLVRWILVERRKGKKLYEVVIEKDKYKNSLVFLLLIILLASIITLVSVFE